VLNILANVASGSKKAVSEVRAALQGISEWFDEYMSKEESTPGQVGTQKQITDDCLTLRFEKEPELNKAMVLLLARCWEYKLKTDDVLELTKVECIFTCDVSFNIPPDRSYHGVGKP
jgi:hypothetical protein